MTQYLVRNKAFDTRKLVVVDVGARYGGARHWDVYGDQIKFIGFEPDEEECKNLNEKFSLKGHQYFPVALHRDKGRRTFYITEYSASSGFYQNDMTFWSRFPDKENVSIKKTMPMDTVDFDSFAESHRIAYVDFMKLDTEGAELDILEGSINYLRKGLLLGAAIEVRFLDCSKQPVFSEVDAFMRQMGFKLFNIEVYRHTREVLPEVLDYIGSTTKRGQVIWADTIYLRDAVAEIESANINNWDDISILKLTSLFEVYGLPDCAIELLQVSKKNNYLKDMDIGYLTDLLTPQFKGKDVTYREYLEKVKAAKDEKEPLFRNVLWKGPTIIAARYLPGPIKRFIKKVLLRQR